MLLEGVPHQAQTGAQAGDREGLLLVEVVAAAGDGERVPAQAAEQVPVPQAELILHIEAVAAHLVVSVAGELHGTVVAGQ